MASLRIRTADARARLLALFSGKLDIHLMPLFWISPPRCAGKRDDASAGIVAVTKEVAVRIYSVAVTHAGDRPRLRLRKPVPILVDYTFNC